VSRPLRSVRALGLALLCLAPVPGDIGACAQPADRLDAPTYFRAKATVDCRACRRCGIDGERCRAACAEPPETEFPDGCEPVVHDGEVCLRALLATDCEDYAEILSDRQPRVPLECDFCPARRAP